MAFEDSFARSERKVPPRARPAPALPADERVTVVCGCGVLMSLAWRTAEPVRCFGCGREFAAPPTVTAAPLRWRPELAARSEHRLVPLVRAITIAGILLGLLGAAIGLLHGP